MWHTSKIRVGEMGVTWVDIKGGATRLSRYVQAAIGEVLRDGNRWVGIQVGAVVAGEYRVINRAGSEGITLGGFTIP